MVRRHGASRPHERHQKYKSMCMYHLTHKVHCLARPVQQILVKDVSRSVNLGTQVAKMRHHEHDSSVWIGSCHLPRCVQSICSMYT